MEDENRKIIIYSDGGKWNSYSFLYESQSEKEELERLRNEHKEELKRYENNKKYDLQYWTNRIEKEKNRIYKVTTFKEFEKLQREYYLNKPLIEVTKQEFDDALNVLPPLKWCTINGVNQFLMSEFDAGVYTTQYARYNNKYYCKKVDAYDPTTWIHNLLNK